MTNLTQELNQVLKKEKLNEEFMALEEIFNPVFEKEFNKKINDINVAYITFEAMYNKHKKDNKFSMESHSSSVSMENFLTELFDTIVKAIVAVFRFIYELVVRIFNAIISMFEPKKPKGAELIINNNTKMIAFVYRNNISDNWNIKPNLRTLEGVRSSLELCVKAQSSLMHGFYEVVKAYQTGNPLEDKDFLLADIIDKIFDSSPVTINLNENYINDGVLKILEPIEANDIIFEFDYANIPTMVVNSFKLKKEKVELETHTYTKTKIDVSVNTVIQQLDENELTGMFIEITDEMVVTAITSFEKFIEDCKRNKSNFLGSVSGYDRKVDSAARGVSRLLRGSRGIVIDNRDYVTDNLLNETKDFIKIATNINKFTITYLKDVLMSTMSTYNSVPNIYTIPETN